MTERLLSIAEAAEARGVSPAADRLLTADEAAAMLGVPVNWVREASRQQRLPYVQLGRYKRYRRESLEQFIEQSEVEPTRPTRGRRMT